MHLENDGDANAMNSLRESNGACDIPAFDYLCKGFLKDSTL